MSVSNLDDRDPAFVYTGFWGQMAVEGLEFAGTSTWTNLSLSTAVISFTGVQVTVFGTIAPIGDGAAPTTFYSLDNLPTKQAYTAVQQSQAQYRQQFFQSEILSSGAHTLEIQYLANEGQFILDYVQVQAAQGNSNQAPATGTTLTQTTTTTATTAPTVSTKATDSTSESSTAPTSATGSTTQSSTKTGQTGLTTSTTPTSLTTPAPSGTAQAASTTAGLVTTPIESSSSPTSPAASLSERRTHNTMPTVGGVVGGIVLLGIVIVGVIIWRKKRNRMKAFPTTLPVTSEIVTPFHPQPLPADNMTGSSYFTSGESKSSAQLLSFPPPAYE